MPQQDWFDQHAPKKEQQSGDWFEQNAKPKVDPNVAKKNVAAYPKETPESTFTKVKRGAAIGAFEGVGVKPATTPKEVVTGSIHQFGQGLKQLIQDTYNEQHLTGMNPAVLPPQIATLSTMLDLIPNMIDKTATGLEQGMKDTKEALKRKDWEAAAQSATRTITQIALLRSARKAKLGEVSPLREAAAGFEESKVGPKEVPIAGQKIPVLKGEADPSSLGGRVQKSLKQAGIGAEKFNQFAIKQTERVKEVIRKTAEKTGGLVNPTKLDPGPAVRSASDATFDKARPMYEALDEAAATVPDSLSEVSKVTQQAIERAKKLGVEVKQGEPESVVVSGQKYTPTNNPRAWELLKKQGLVPETGGQPITTYIKIRSELLKMQRASSDAALRNHIGNEVSSMNQAMDAALEGTPLKESWHEANRLWSKGYALRDVADALRESTEGTPTEFQAPGLKKVATTMKGPGLVKRLNDLANDGVLDKAFTPEEVKNLRQCADILDRAASSAGTEFKVGYGVHSTVWRNLIGLPFYRLVNTMTTTQGVQALRAGHIEVFLGLAGFSVSATEGQKKRKKPGEQLKDIEAIQHSHNPALAGAGEER